MASNGDKWRRMETTNGEDLWRRNAGAWRRWVEARGIDVASPSGVAFGLLMASLILGTE